jgi:hypothetical protein
MKMKRIWIGCFLVFAVALLLFSCAGEQTTLPPKAKALLDEYESIVDRYASEVKDTSLENKAIMQREYTVEVHDWFQKWQAVYGSLSAEEAQKASPRLKKLNNRATKLFN